MKRIIEASATMQDAEYLAANLRERDIREIRLVSKDDNIRKHVVGSFLISKHRFSVYDGEKLLGIFGSARCDLLGKGHALIWLLGTKHLEENDYSREFLAIGRKYLPLLFVGFEVLENFISHENTASFKWLNRLGFVFEKKNEKIYHFYMNKEF